MSYAILTATLGGGLVQQGHAQVTGEGFTLTRFYPAHTNLGVLDAQSATLPEADYGLKLATHFAWRPLVPEGAGDTGELTSPLAHRAPAHVMWWGRPFERWIFGLDLPMMLDQRPLAELQDDVTRSGVGDLRGLVRFQAFSQDKSHLNVALQLAIALPSSQRRDHLGESSLVYWPELLVDKRYQALRWIINVGYRGRSAPERTGLGLQNELSARFALAWRPLKGEAPGKYEIQGGLTRAIAAGTPFSSASQEHLDAHLGGAWWMSEQLRGGVFIGRGLLFGLGSPEVSAGVTLSYEFGVVTDEDEDGIMDKADQCPTEPEDRDLFEDDDGCPDFDNDQDGVLDNDDQCPLQAEDRDSFEDDDGCPEPDNDQDAIPDVSDECPLEPEDQDRFKDDDGCPELDNDQDGVPDVEDKCPNQPGPRSLGGCPDVDLDRDGVLNLQDKCPKVMGLKELQGCPLSRVTFSAKKLELLEPLLFVARTEELQSSSTPLLIEIASVLNTYPQLRVRIEGHTDSTGKTWRNRELSQKRAERVRAFLESKGVAKERMICRGYGPDRPIATNDTRAGRAKNVRVHFTVLNPKTMAEVLKAEESASGHPVSPLEPPVHIPPPVERGPLPTLLDELE